MFRYLDKWRSSIFFSVANDIFLKEWPLSARALVKKAQEPGIKLKKADFFRNDTRTSPQTKAEESPKIPFVHFYPPPVGEGGFSSRQDSVRRHVFLLAQKLKNYWSIFF